MAALTGPSRLWPEALGAIRRAVRQAWSAGNLETHADRRSLVTTVQLAKDVAKTREHAEKTAKNTDKMANKKPEPAKVGP